MRRAAKSRALRLALAGALYEDGFDGLLRDKTRPSRHQAARRETAERVAALTLGELQPRMSCLTRYLLLNPTFPQFGLHGLGKV
jgi:hypothetical protein